MKSAVLVPVLLSVAGGVCTPASAMLAQQTGQPDQETPASPTPERDGRAYPVSRFVFEYPLAHPELPPTEALADTRVTLGKTAEGYVGPWPWLELVEIRLGDVQTETVFWGSAIAAINQAVRGRLEREFGMIGHLVTPVSTEIDFEGDRSDLRAPGNTTLTIQVWRATVDRVRSVGFGQKWYEREDNLDNPRHGWIREKSPLQEGDLLRKPALDDRLAFLNRHPGRRVDAALSPTGEPGGVVLDYLVTEAKDWSVYYQLTNTGSESTNEWVHRFGFFDNQLTGHDDILSVDYITAGFDESHVVLGSYSFPISPSRRVRAKVYGRYNRYTSNDVGAGLADFEGEGYELGAEVSANVWQAGPAFLDLFGGVRWEHISVENSSLLIDGDEDFVIPYLGARVERDTPLSRLFAELTLDFGTGGSDDLNALGRFNAEGDFMRLRGQASTSFFLEPLVDPRGFRGERGPDHMTLAHQLYFSARFQTTFGDRVVPNYQQTAGGFFTVRGYDESEAVGDNAIIATAEYRFYLGRALPQTEELGSLAGRPFRDRRTEPYGGADWDLLLRTFIDVGRVTNEDRVPLVETDATLVGVGLGAELRVKNNLTLRVDYGVGLTGVGEGLSRRADSGDSHLHFMATILY